MKTIDCPERLRPYLPWLLRFLRREIPLTADLLWSADILTNRVQLRTDHPTGAIESSEHTLHLEPPAALLLTDFLRGFSQDLGTVTATLVKPSLCLTLHSTHHKGAKLALPEITLGVPGVPDPILTAIEATDTGLLLHLRFRLTHAPFTVAVI